MNECDMFYNEYDMFHEEYDPYQEQCAPFSWLRQHLFVGALLITCLLAGVSQATRRHVERHRFQVGSEVPVDSMRQQYVDHTIRTF